MTAKRDYTASITTSGLDGTGLTDEVARKLYSRRGRGTMAIVELVVDETGDKRDGTHKVKLAVASLELALDNGDMDDHLRELSKTLHYNRSLEGHTGTTTDGIEPKVSDVLAAGQRHRPHPFLPVDAADDNGICDVCGGIASAGVHSAQDFLPDGDEEEPCDACGFVAEHAEDCPIAESDQVEEAMPEWEQEVAAEQAKGHLSAVGDPFTP